jgi:YD repeat-containing protein
VDRQRNHPIEPVICTRNRSGKLTFSIDPNGVQTAYAYNDQLDRVTQIRRVAGGNASQESQTNYLYPNSTWSIEYQDQKSTDDGLIQRQSVYDGFGRLVENRTIEDGANYIATDTAYDALGRVAATYNPSRMTNGQSDGLGYATTMSYDALGRVVNVKTADGSTTTTSYTGNQTTVTDPAGKSRQYTYNALGMLTKVVEDPSGLNYTTSYQYDALGDLTQVTQGSEIRSFGYDSLGRLLWAVNPESGTINYRYDASGNLVWRDDNMGRQTCYSYDALNRITQKIYFTGNYAAQGGNCAAVPGSAYLADSPMVSYSYDSANISYGMGRLAKVTNGISTTTVLSYDAEGRTLASQQSTGGKTYNLFYGYDLNGALTSETYPSGRQITTQFDGAGREAKINGALGGQPSTYLGWISYAPHGGVGLMQYGNNVWQATYYNSRLQPYEALDVINNDINKLLRAECLYWSGSYNLTACGAENHTDNNGNPRATVFWYGNGGTSVSASFNETFAYDGVNRLTGVVDNGGWSRYFAYDQYSNMWLCGWPGIAPNGSAPTANYCSQTPSGIFNTANRIGTGSYDAAGNQLTVAGSNLSYDAENRITSAVQPGIGTVTYTYDGDGRRVMKSVSTGLQTVYVYDIGGKLVAEYSSGATSVPPCHTCFLSTDHLGSTRLVTDENGNTVSRHDYIPFGEEIAANSGGRDGTFGTQDFVNQ